MIEEAKWGWSKSDSRSEGDDGVGSAVEFVDDGGSLAMTARRRAAGVSSRKVADGSIIENEDSTFREGSSSMLSSTLLLATGSERCDGPDCGPSGLLRGVRDTLRRGSRGGSTDGESMPKSKTEDELRVVAIAEIGRAHV